MNGCESNGLLYHHPVYTFAIFIQGLSSFLAFPMMFFVFKKYGHKVYYHSNLLFLVALNAASCLILAGLTAWSATNFFVQLIIKPSPCDMLMRTEFCSKIRASFLFAFLLVSTSHAGILIERSCATIFVKSYEKQGKALGAILAILAVTVSALTIYVVIYNEDKEEFITTCLTFSASKSIGNQIYAMFFAQLILDALVSIVHLCLYNYNKRTTGNNSVSLSEQFQRNENMKTLKQVTPLMILSNVTIGVYIFVISVFRLSKNYLPVNWYEIIAALLFIMPHMPLMFSSLLFFEFCRDERRLVAVRRKIVADQENAQTDQLNMLIENWETKFESRENDSRVVREHTASSKLCRFFNKRQRTIAAIY